MSTRACLLGGRHDTGLEVSRNGSRVAISAGTPERCLSLRQCEGNSEHVGPTLEALVYRCRKQITRPTELEDPKHPESAPSTWALISSLSVLPLPRPKRPPPDTKLRARVYQIPAKTPATAHKSAEYSPLAAADHQNEPHDDIKLSRVSIFTGFRPRLPIVGIATLFVLSNLVCCPFRCSHRLIYTVGR